MSRMGEKVVSNASRGLGSSLTGLELILSKIPSETQPHIDQIYSLLTDVRVTPEQQQQLTALMVALGSPAIHSIPLSPIFQFPSVDSEMSER
jgi:hypothetical protein